MLEHDKKTDEFLAHMGVYIDMDEEELAHYGVVGMKWGVHKATRKAARNEKLEKKALNYDKKSAAAYKKSEKIHSKEDLESSNRAAKKAGNYSKKAAVVQKKANKETSELKKGMLEKKAAKLQYKSTKQKMKANQISKTTGYGVKAMKYSVKSDRMARKAAKARMKMANNEYYINVMKQKAKSIPKEDIQKGYEFVNEFLKHSIDEDVMLMHYGRKGMKWGQRIFSKKDTFESLPEIKTPKHNAKQQAAFDVAKKSFDEHQEVSNRYFSEATKGVNPMLNPHRDEYKRTEKRLIDDTKKYLKTLDKNDVDNIVKYDDEHDEYYVDDRFFDKTIEYEGGNISWKN